MSVKLDFKKIYACYFGSTRGAFHATSRESFDPVPIATGKVLPKKSLVFDQHYGTKPRDIIGTGYGVIALFSDRLVSILHDEKFTGWSPFPVEVYRKDGTELAGYHGISVTGRCAPFDDSQSIRP